jgi:hypothetical protein
MEHPQPFAFDPHREALAALELAPGSVYLLLDVAFRNCVQGSSAPKSQGIITAEFPYADRRTAEGLHSCCITRLRRPFS